MRLLIVLAGCIIYLSRHGNALVHCASLNTTNSPGFHFFSYVYNETAIPGPDETHISFEARLKNALDNNTLTCHVAGDGYMVEGPCHYPDDGTLGGANTTISIGRALPFNDNESEIRVWQTFQCIKSENERPYTASVYSYFHLYLDCRTGPLGKICAAESSNPFPDGTGISLDILYPSPLRNCSKASRSSPTWRVTTFDWSFIPLLVHGDRHDFYPSDSTSVGNLNMRFRFDNIDFQYDCFGLEARLGPINPPKYSPENAWIKCEGDFWRSNAQPETTPTWFLFNWKTFELKLNQTWSCDDADGGRSEFYGLGSTTLKLNCHSVAWGGHGQGCSLEEPATIYPAVEKLLLPAHS